MIKKNKWIFTALLLGTAMQLSCSNEEDSVEIGNWIELSNFEGKTRASAVAFSIEGSAYVGTGYSGTDDEYYNDFWAYDIGLNYWKRIADFPGVARSSSVSFSIGNKGYVGTGYDGTNRLKDFYEYDPSTNIWTQIADFGGTARRGAVAFALNGRGYVGTGYDGNDLKDFWEYNPSTNTWIQIPSIGGSKRTDAAVFVVGGKAYVGTGTHNGAYKTDIWEFDPANMGDDSNPWTKKVDLADDDYDYNGVIREGTVTFTINGHGYVATGSYGSVLGTVWEYDPIYDTWEEVRAFEGTSRTDAVAFTIGDRGFVALGRNSSTYFDDIWEFAPDMEYDKND